MRYLLLLSMLLLVGCEVCKKDGDEGYHNFVPRYSVEETEPIFNDVTARAVNDAFNDDKVKLIASCKRMKQTYHFDICSRCGTIVKRDDLPADAPIINGDNLEAEVEQYDGVND